MYKEGQGRLNRQMVKPKNLCFYDHIYGTWSRGILHGKRIEYKMNLNVFPKGYYTNAAIDDEKVQKKNLVKSLSFTFEMKRGVFNGTAVISINDKKVCKTKFSDQIEFI